MIGLTSSGLNSTLVISMTLSSFLVSFCFTCCGGATLARRSFSDAFFSSDASFVGIEEVGIVFSVFFRVERDTGGGVSFLNSTTGGLICVF